MQLTADFSSRLCQYVLPCKCNIAKADKRYNLIRSTMKTTKCEILFYMVLYSTRSFTLARNNWYIASKAVNIVFKCHCKLSTPLNTLLFIGCFQYILASSFFKSKKSTCETRKNGFSYTSKALFILKKIKF